MISFPVGNARKSGVLFPSLGTTSSSGVAAGGAVLLQPRAEPGPDADADLATRSRGVDLDGEFRFLTEDSRGQLDGNLLPDDGIRRHPQPHPIA